MHGYFSWFPFRHALLFFIALDGVEVEKRFILVHGYLLAACSVLKVKSSPAIYGERRMTLAAVTVAPCLPPFPLGLDRSTLCPNVLYFSCFLFDFFFSFFLVIVLAVACGLCSRLLMNLFFFLWV